MDKVGKDCDFKRFLHCHHYLTFVFTKQFSEPLFEQSFILTSFEQIKMLWVLF